MVALKDRQHGAVAVAVQGSDHVCVSETAPADVQPNLQGDSRTFGRNWPFLQTQAARHVIEVDDLLDDSGLEVVAESHYSTSDHAHQTLRTGRLEQRPEAV